MKPVDQGALARRLQARGLKCTPQRLAIYAALSASDDHPSAEVLYRDVKADYPMLSRNTVYQTLEALTTAGLAQAIRTGRSHARYDGNSEPHHHMVCLSCDRVEDFHDASLERLAAPARLRRRYRVVHHRVEFYGYCRTCHDRNPHASRVHSHKEEIRHG
ncbi:MAG TPA: transcriptional repressor [Nitrospiria bacterium]|nr:transcriptional repressor [Nitrospiria bacterium]